MDAGQERQAFELIERAAAAGDVDAVDYLGWFYDHGRVVARDLARAVSHYRRAAEGGQRHAQWRLGVMLDLGEGVAPDPVEAVRWFRKAADQGSSNAIASLAAMYANGRGVAQDFSEAQRLYREAARRTNPAGFFGMGVLFMHGQGVQRDRVESLAWMLAAATLGDERAQDVVPKFGLPVEETERAVTRGNDILQEHGLGNHQIKFRNLDVEGEPEAVPNA
jgi:hypothetical protein